VSFAPFRQPRFTLLWVAGLVEPAQLASANALNTLNNNLGSRTGYAAGCSPAGHR